jgi:lipopolysaccharide assembly protein A
MRCKLILSIILVGMAVVFTIQNVAAVELTFLFWTLSMSRVLLVFLILSIGTTLGWMANVGMKRIKTTPNAKQGSLTDKTLA